MGNYPNDPTSWVKNWQQFKLIGTLPIIRHTHTDTYTETHTLTVLRTNIFITCVNKLW